MPFSIDPFSNRLPIGLALLSKAPAFLQPKCFRDIWAHSDSLSSHVALKLPGPAGLPGNELAYSIAKTGATLSFAHVPSPLASVIAKIRHTRYATWRRNPSHNSLFCQIPSVSSEELAIPRLARCEPSRLRCHGHSLLAAPAEPSAVSNSPSRLSRIFDSICFIFDLWARHWSVGRLLRLRRIPPRPHPSEGVG